MERKHPLCICEDCTLQDRKFTPWWNPAIKQLPIFFIGQAPGEVEALCHKVFSGPAGKRHWSLCKAAGINKEMCAHSNSVACWPPQVNGNDRRPDLSEIACCHGRLKEEIHTVKPKLIIALGDCAMETLTGHKMILKERGRFHKLLDIYDYPCDVLCVLHPSFVMRQPQWTDAAVTNLKQILQYLSGESQDSPEVKFTYDPDAQTLREYIKLDPECVDVDTETTGLNTLKDEILGHSFSSTDNSAMAIVYTTPKENDPRWYVVKSFIEDPKRGKCWQNGSFDTEIARTWDIKDDGFVFDTRLAQQLISSDLPSDLDFLRSEYTSIQSYKPSKKEYKNISSLGKQKILELACWDALTTRLVRKEQMKKLSTEELNLMRNLLIPLVRAIGRIERRGFYTNETTIATLMVYYQPKVAELEKVFWDLGLNPRSPVQFCNYFGLKSTKEDILKAQIKREHPQSELMQKLLDFRGWDVLVSKYIIGVHRRRVNGRIHTHFKIEGTGTGRLSSENPNLQNIPEEMRVIYEPDPGYTLVEIDYSQIELWVGAILSGGQGMLEDLKKGVDIHYVSCQLCFPHVPLIHGSRKKDFDHRQGLIAKTVTFGTFYGRSARSIAIEFGVTTAEAEMWQVKILNKYPELKDYKRRCEEDFSKRGFMRTPFGRRRFISSITQGYNFPIQSSASDVTLYSIVEMDRAGFEILATVHDSIVIQIKTENLLSELVRARKIIERPFKELAGQGFKASYKRGPNWYEMEDITDEVKCGGLGQGPTS